jgi:hypothetical protein
MLLNYLLLQLKYVVLQVITHLSSMTTHGALYATVRPTSGGGMSLTLRRRRL